MPIPHEQRPSHHHHVKQQQQMERKEEERYVPLPLLIGGIKEKGFSSSSSSSSSVSVPQPRATPFPVARHRSEGPHWAPLPRQEAQLAPAAGDDLEAAEGVRLDVEAQPLGRRKKSGADLSKWKQIAISQVVDEAVQPRRKDSKGDIKRPQQHRDQEVDLASPAANCDKGLRTSDKAMNLATPISPEVEIDSTLQMACRTSTFQPADQDIGTGLSKNESSKGLALSTIGEASQVNSRESIVRFREEMEAENQAVLQSMTDEQIVDAQIELAERLRPDILDMLKERGKVKVRRYDVKIHEGQGKSTEDNVKKENALSLEAARGRVEEGRNTKDMHTRTTLGRQENMAVASTSAFESNPGESTVCERPWSDRVEAVRLLRFGIDGNVVLKSSFDELPQSGDDKQWQFPNATERDFLRFDGDPAADGYTIKEAVALARSMVPAQRSAALRLLAKLLSNCLSGLQVDNMRQSGSPDWRAVWAYALGPEPELVLTLRVALDDSHATVVATCARVIECVLNSSENEDYFNMCEFVWAGSGQLFTAPIFRKSSFQEEGLVGGGYWKYNVKPSDMFPFLTNNSQNSEEERTVKDDAYIANQDVAAGLIRMGILPRIRYILEVEKLIAAEESLLNVLIALARHSPDAAELIMTCPRLMDTISKRLCSSENLDFGSWSSKSKAIHLLKVLSLAKRGICTQLLETGLFQHSQLGLLHQGLALSGEGKAYQGQQCSLMGLVESIRFWIVCIKYQLGISYFADFYPALIFWVSPSAQLLQSASGENIVLAEASFHLLETLAGTLQVLHAGTDSDNKYEIAVCEEGTLKWSWNYAMPLVETSLEWLSPEVVSSIIQNFCDRDVCRPLNAGNHYLLRAVSSVLHFLATLCGKILDKSRIRGIDSGPLWLPTFVPKLSLQLINSRLLGFRGFESGNSKSPKTRDGSLVDCFLKLTRNFQSEALLEIISCFHGLVRLLKELDYLLTTARRDRTVFSLQENTVSSTVEEILTCGLAMSVKEELEKLFWFVGDYIIHHSHNLYLVDSRRGGPAPGVGVGWGCLGRGYWSHQAVTARMAVTLFTELVQVVCSLRGGTLFSSTCGSILGTTAEEADGNIPAVQKALFNFGNLTYSAWNVKVGLHASVAAGPGDADIVEHICSDVLFHRDAVHLYIEETDVFLGRWLKKVGSGEYLQMREGWLSNLHSKAEDVSQILLLHVKNVWLEGKGKSLKSTEQQKGSKYLGKLAAKHKHQVSALPSVNEESDSPGRERLAGEWARQRLPLPSHWFLSPFLFNKHTHAAEPGNISGMDGRIERFGFAPAVHRSTHLEIVGHGLLFLCALETLNQHSPGLVLYIPHAVKIHALSNIFLLSDDIFLDKAVRSMVGALQEFYCDQLNEQIPNGMCDTNNMAAAVEKHVGPLDFEAIVDERYPSFVERLSNQFAAVSYGDLVFGRQVAMYLRMDVSEVLRIRVWKVLESEHALGLLPTLEQCCGHFSAYLYPYENNLEILGMYASAWTTGGLDRAKVRNAVPFLLAVFHVSAFLFKQDEMNKPVLRAFASNFLMSLAGESLLQDSLLKLVTCNVHANQIEAMFEPPSLGESVSRCCFLEEVCSNSPAVLAGICHVKNQLALQI